MSPAARRRFGRAAASTVLAASLQACGKDAGQATDSVTWSHGDTIARQSDSLLIAVNDSVGALFSETLTSYQKALIVSAAADPGEVVKAFLDSLPLDTTSAAPAPGMDADTVFRFMTQGAANLRKAAEGFAWGKAIAMINPDLGRDVACPATGCLASARTKSVEHRMDNPAVIAIERPEIESFLSQSLRSAAHTAPIAESRHRDARRSIARAVCKGGVPVVQYSPEISDLFSPISFTFVRAHELAHINLRHVRCDGDRRGEGAIPDVRTRELMADCEASRIVQRIKRGESIVAAVAERFYSLNWPARDYPSTRERYDSLWTAGC